MSAENEHFVFEDLSIHVTYDGEMATIAWRGMSEIPDPELSVGPFLRRLLGSLHGKKVTVDFRELDYMNSATLQPVLKLVKELNQRSIDTTVTYNSTMEWQRITFRCIKAITQPLTFIHFTNA
jgi:hypothetical protein